MTKENIQPYIFYIARTKVFVFHPSLKNVLEVDIPDTVVKDLEIKKTAELENILSTFVQQNKMAAGPVYIILSPEATLEKTLPTTTSEKLKIQVEDAVKLAPFNHVGWSTVPAGKDTYLVLVNRELFEGFQEILERLGFHVSAVTPARTLGISLAAFNAQVGFEILKKAQVVYQNSFIADPEMMTQAQNNLSSDPRRNKKLLMLLVAFAVLILVLGGLVVKMAFFPDKSQPEKAVQTRRMPTVSSQAPTVLTTPTVSASPSATLGSTRIQVLNASGETGLAQSTKDLLTDSGFTVVDTGNAATITSDKIQVVFSPGVPTNVREAIIKSLGTKFPNPATRDGENSDSYDVVITLTDTTDSGT